MTRAVVRWSAGAERGLDDIVARIARESPARAVAFARRLLAKVARLGMFPLSGRKAPELADLDHSAREIIVGDYRVLYRVQGRTVEVAAVVHGRRLLPSI